MSAERKAAFVFSLVPLCPKVTGNSMSIGIQVAISSLDGNSGGVQCCNVQLASQIVSTLRTT